MAISYGARSRLNPPAGHAEFADKLQDLSEASVYRNFDPYLDINWDAPELAVTPNDPRWILHDRIDPIGRHPWYQALPREKQIALGMWRQANVAKVGLQFESILVAGFMHYMFAQNNNSPEFRYAAHESREECNHMMMFQEFVNRVDPSVPGVSPMLRLVSRFIPTVGSMFPLIFFMGVLGGEEPIDHIQKEFLRTEETQHPIMTEVMRVHVAEEARHISFAHEWLKLQIPNRGFFPRLLLSVTLPIVMRLLMSAIVVPPRSFFRKFDIPREVRKDIYWRLPESKETRRDILADVRMLAKDCKLVNPLSRLVWKAVGLNGRPSRHRSEPSYAAPVAA